MLKKILWALAPVIASRLLGGRRRGSTNSRANKTRWNKNYRR